MVITTLHYVNVDTKRAQSEKDMAQYLEGLQKGVDWKPNDPIVRSFAVHDSHELSIQQLITLYVSSPKPQDDTNWKGMHTHDQGLS